MRARRWIPTSLALLGALAFAPAAWTGVDSVTLAVSQPVATYLAPVEFSGQVTPAVAGEPVTVSVQSGEGWEPLGIAETGADGVFRLQADAVSPGPFLAAAGPAQSEPVALTIRPRLTATLRGKRMLGAALRLSGRLEPSKAGTLRFTMDGETRAVRLSPTGTFSARVTAGRPGPEVIKLRLEPAEGYAGTTRTLRPRIAAPNLRLGSGGPAVLFLERQLARLGYVLLGVNSRYSQDTADAVLAFRKVRGLARTGSVDRVLWRALTSASRPRARVANGDHIEVYKTRQVLFEVRRGQVVRVVHVSTGATGNTPVGHWRVYSKQPGYNAIGMYYSLYFLRGFAIHGYSPVPPYPASHGCVRVPIWFAKGLYDRWPRGATVLVFA